MSFEKGRYKDLGVTPYKDEMVHELKQHEHLQRFHVIGSFVDVHWPAI